MINKAPLFTIQVNVRLGLPGIWLSTQGKFSSIDVYVPNINTNSEYEIFKAIYNLVIKLTRKGIDDENSL